MDQLLPSRKAKVEINDLSTELLFTILSELERTRRETLFQTTRVCKRWHYISQPLIHRVLGLILSPGSRKRNDTLFERLESKSDLRQMLREIHVYEWYASELIELRKDSPSRLDWPQLCSRKDLSETRACTLNQIDRLCTLISKCSLRKFIWNAKPRLPLNLISVLETHQPQCHIEIRPRIDIDFPYQTVYPPIDTSITSIQRLQGLRRLRVLSITIYQDKTSHFVELVKAISVLPLRSLTIHALGKEAYGCIPHPLTRCPWKQEQKLVGFQALTELELVNFCLCADSEAEDDWLNIFPWSQLTHVSLTCGSFLVHSAVGERLKHVQSLSISLDPSYEYGPGCGSDFDKSLVNHYLMTCDRLARLKMVNCSLTVDEKLFIHLGGTLKELELHQYEEYGGARPVLNSTQVEQIGKHCPSLRKLAIDIHDLYGWFIFGQPYDVFDALAEHLWFVCHLELNCACGTPWDVVNRAPQINFDTSKAMWDCLWTRWCSAISSKPYQHNRHAGLHTLNISVGPAVCQDMLYSSTDEGGTLYAVRRTYEIRRLTNIDYQNELGKETPKQVSVSVICLELERVRERSKEDLGQCSETWRSQLIRLENKARRGEDLVPRWMLGLDDDGWLVSDSEYEREI